MVTFFLKHLLERTITLKISRKKFTVKGHFWLLTQSVTFKVFTTVFTILAISFLLINLSRFTFYFITEAYSRREKWKHDSFRAVSLVDERYLRASFVTEACSFTAAIIIYWDFDLNKLLLFKSKDLVNRNRRWRLTMCFERSLPFLPTCQEKQVLTRVKQERISYQKDM